MNNRGTGIDPWGTPCFNVPQSEKHFELNSVMLLQLSVFY